MKLAVAESLTGGRLQAEITKISGISAVFLGGITAYTLAQKVRLLGVTESHARSVNCVSAQVAREMAKGACRLFGADIGAATTGYTEPDPSHNVEQPLAYWAIYRAADKQFLSGQMAVGGVTRTQMQELVAKVVFRELVNCVVAT